MRLPDDDRQHDGKDGGFAGDQGDLPASHAAGQGGVDMGRAWQRRVLVPAGRRRRKFQWHCQAVEPSGRVR